MKDSIGVVFVNTHSKTKTYSPAETTIEEELTETLAFMKTLGIEDVQVFQDLSKTEIIEKFEVLQEKVETFNKRPQNGV